MDPRHSAQDVVRCDLCKENIVQSYCDFCQASLCKPCIGEHISDDYHKHVIVPFQERKSTPMFPICKIHSKETCKLQCKSYTAFLCVVCFASHEHKDSDFIVLEDIYKTKKRGIQNDTEEIEWVIAPTYEEVRNDLIDQIARLDGEYEKITTVMSEEGEKWHAEVDRVINKMKNEITGIKEKHRGLLEKHLMEIKQIESLIDGNISVLKELEESNDVSVIVVYGPIIKEFRKRPAKVLVTLPSFSPKPINGVQFYEMLGSIKPLVSATDEDGYKMKSPEVSSRELLDIPDVIGTFNTGYKELWEAGAVVVVNQDGKLRWRYTGHFSGANKNSFTPSGITTNSQSQILTADCNNHCIHIMDQDGQFLRYIVDVKNPYGLCVDKLDNLYVAEYKTGDVKVIKYLK